jgi:hypothetical protein
MKYAKVQHRSRHKPSWRPAVAAAVTVFSSANGAGVVDEQLAVNKTLACRAIRSL